MASLLPLLDRAWETTTTTGTGTMTLSGMAITAFQTWAAAGAVNGQTYPYLIQDGTAWEIGTGTFTSSGTTLSRTLISSSTGSLLNLSGNASVTCVFTAEEWSTVAVTGRLLNIQRFSSHQTVTPTYNALTTSIVIKLLGAGGGGRSVAAPSAGQVAIGAPGGGGAYLEKRLTSSFSGKQLVVGQGGAGGAASGAPNNGANGGATTFDASGGDYSAGGGVGGTASDAAAYGWLVARINIGGSATNGDLNVSASGLLLNLSVSDAAGPSAMSTGGTPAAPQYGAAGVADVVLATTASGGGSGSGNGSGGSGAIAFNGNTPLGGGNGTDGYCEIWEYS